MHWGNTELLKLGWVLQQHKSTTTACVLLQCPVSTVFTSLSSHYCLHFTVQSLLSSLHCPVTTVFTSLSSHYCLHFTVQSLLSSLHCPVSTVYTSVAISLRLYIHMSLQKTGLWWGRGGRDFSLSVHSQGFTKDLAKMGGRVGREGEGYSQTQVSVTWGGRPPVRQSCRNVGPWMRDARRRAGWSLVPCRTARLRSSSAPTHASPAKPSHSTALSSSTFTLQQQPIPNTRCVSKHTHTLHT